MLFFRSIAMLFALNFLITGANAGAARSATDDQTLKIAGTLSEGEFATPPQAFYPFCARFTKQCMRSGGNDPVALDRKHWSEILNVNKSVNQNIRPKTEMPGIDIWTVGAQEGDCDAFAIEKRKELIDLGWPSSALTLTVVYTRSAKAHLVLTVKTDHGEFLLDNLRSAILGVDAVEYKFVIRQSSIHPTLWVTINRIKTAAAFESTLTEEAYNSPNFKLGRITS